MTRKKKLIEHIFKSACNYGMADPKKKDGKEKFLKCMNSIPDDLFDDFIYTLERVAEKSGDEGFILSIHTN